MYLGKEVKLLILKDLQKVINKKKIYIELITNIALS